MSSEEFTLPHWVDKSIEEICHFSLGHGQEILGLNKRTLKVPTYFNEFIIVIG